MSPRLRLAGAFTALVVLATIAAVLGTGRNRAPSEDPRRSTFLTTPAGASGWAEALRRLGVRVEVSRVRPEEFAERLVEAEGRVLGVALDPSQPFDAFDGTELAAVVHDGRDLLVAGPGAEAAIRCLGYDIEPIRRDSVRAALPGGERPYVTATLVAHGETRLVDTVEAVSGVISDCAVPEIESVDTLLRTEGGRPVALRLVAESGGTAIVAADGALFSNRRLRSTTAGPWALALVAGRYDAVVVDEYHHGFEAGGSLLDSALAWARRSPWGWALWQLALVAVLAIVAGAVRFGPSRPLADRRRRSPLEHVRALATALAAARGHDVAIRLLVNGLRRRLARTGEGRNVDARAWLAGLTPHLRTERARAAASTLALVTVPPQNAESVLRAAHAVDDLWEELRP